MQIDYSKLILTGEERKAFQKFYNSDEAFLTVSEYKLLSSKGLITHAINGKSTWFEDPSDGNCKISQKGKEYRSYLADEMQRLAKAEEQSTRAITLSKWSIGIAIVTAILTFLMWLFPRNPI